MEFAGSENTTLNVHQVVKSMVQSYLHKAYGANAIERYQKIWEEQILKPNGQRIFVFAIVEKYETFVSLASRKIPWLHPDYHRVFAQDVLVQPVETIEKSLASYESTKGPVLPWVLRAIAYKVWEEAIAVNSRRLEHSSLEEFHGYVFPDVPSYSDLGEEVLRSLQKIADHLQNLTEPKSPAAKTKRLNKLYKMLRGTTSLSEQQVKRLINWAVRGRTLREAVADIRAELAVAGYEFA